MCAPHCQGDFCRMEKKPIKIWTPGEFKTIRMGRCGDLSLLVALINYREESIGNFRFRSRIELQPVGELWKYLIECIHIRDRHVHMEIRAIYVALAYIIAPIWMSIIICTLVSYVRLGDNEQSVRILATWTKIDWKNRSKIQLFT